MAELEADVRRRVRDSGLDPQRDSLGRLDSLIEDALRSHSADAKNSISGDLDSLKEALRARVAGFGPLQPLMDDPDVEEIWINGPGRVFFAANGRHNLTNIVLEEAEIGPLVERMLRASGRRIDLSSPFVDAMLPDGSRLHVAIPDITRRHWAVNIRKYILRAHDLEELVRLGSMSEGAANFLEACVSVGLNIVVSGGTQTGKTTLLNCLAAAIPPQERVITCEEVFELDVRLPDVVPMQTRPPNVEGHGAIDLRRLIIEALRMRPDRIIVGEVRQKEAFDLLVALNSGLPGMTSIHANNAVEALTKLATLPLLAGENVSHGFVVPTVAACVDIVVHLGRFGARRRAQQIVGVSGRVEGDVVETVALWSADPKGMSWTGMFPPQADRFEEAGIDLGRILQ